MSKGMSAQADNFSHQFAFPISPTSPPYPSNRIPSASIREIRDDSLLKPLTYRVNPLASGSDSLSEDGWLPSQVDDTRHRSQLAYRETKHRIGPSNAYETSTNGQRTFLQTLRTQLRITCFP